MTSVDSFNSDKFHQAGATPVISLSTPPSPNAVKPNLDDDRSSKMKTPLLVAMC